jgi:ATP-dependent Clp protease ATP-binding subunit ClpA
LFERFTDRARRVVVFAQEEARLLNHDYIGTEHILLGLVHETEPDVLAELGITLAEVRQKVEESVGRGTKEPAGHILFTSRAKKVLELSLREALTLRNESIGSEHILLGLIREGHNTGCEVLQAIGVDLDRLRQLTISHAAAHSGPEGEGRITRIAVGTGTLGAIEDRLARIEQRLGIAIASSVSELSQRLSQVRREKAAATEAQDFERAVELRGRELQLVAEREAALNEQPSPESVVPITEELVAARAEITRLTELLRSHGIDPEAGPGTPEGGSEGGPGGGPAAGPGTPESAPEDGPEGDSDPPAAADG